MNITLYEEYINKINVFYPIHYIRNKTKGLSLNRNIALKHCKGDYIGFPDDDCFYSPHVLEEVNKAFLQFNAAKFIAVTTCDSITHEQNHFTKKQFLFKKDIFRNCISYNIFQYFCYFLFLTIFHPLPDLVFQIQPIFIHCRLLSCNF